MPESYLPMADGVLEKDPLDFPYPLCIADSQSKTKFVDNCDLEKEKRNPSIFFVIPSLHLFYKGLRNLHPPSYAMKVGQGS